MYWAVLSSTIVLHTGIDRGSATLRAAHRITGTCLGVLAVAAIETLHPPTSRRTRPDARRRPRHEPAASSPLQPRRHLRHAHGDDGQDHLRPRTAGAGPAGRPSRGDSHRSSRPRVRSR
ncbi:FUSC family protein [Streptomyces sp. NPDC005463]|uniref:FUSC family protein n=1 Tax=Streptomyces sp. NPDC005463 TaxID=3154465 RepID=UPI0033A0550C